MLLDVMRSWPFVAFEEVRLATVFTVYSGQFCYCHEVLWFRPLACLVSPY